MDPVERRLEQNFETEKLNRFIQDCQSLEELRQTALFLVQQLAQQKAASSWMASRASESENAKLQILAKLIGQSTGDQATTTATDLTNKE